jgi:alanyl-tRNA synthetase
MAVAERLYYGFPASAVSGVPDLAREGDLQRAGDLQLASDPQGLTEFTAVVTDVRLERREADGAQRWQIALDRTAFYPESGGQPWDTGRLEATAKSGARLEVAVLSVVEDDAGEVWHTCAKPLLEGTGVRGVVDAARRLDHRQQHTGQHLLSAVFLQELQAATVSFHLGAESSTIDLAGESVATLTREDLVRVEERVNALIAEDRPLHVHRVERAEADAMLARGALRKLPERAGAMRLLEIEGVEFNACGGTHLQSLGAIGGLTIRRTEKVRQGLRVEFCCGLRAVRAARMDYDILSGLAALLSVGAAETTARVQAVLDEQKSAGKERRSLLERMAGFEAQAALGVVARDAAVHDTAACDAVEDHPFFRYVLSSGDAAYAKLVALQCVTRRPSLVVLVLVTNVERTDVVLARGAGSAVHCGQMLKAALDSLGSRGGGSAELAQGSLAADRMEPLIETLRAALR